MGFYHAAIRRYLLVIERNGKKLMADQSLFFSPDGRRPLAPSGSRLAASASSSQASRTGFKAIMLLWDRVRDSNLGRALGGFRLEYLGYFNVDG